MNRVDRRRNHMSSLEELWQKESRFLEQLFDDHTPFACKDLMEFHDYVYYHCSSFIHNPSVGSQEPGKHLYEALTHYLNALLKEISTGMENILSDEELIVRYVEHWQLYRKACEDLDRGCRYLNQNWVKQEQLEGHKHIHHVYRLAMIRWKELVFSPIDRALVTAISLTLRQKPRESTRSLVYQALRSIVELYANDERQEVPVPAKLNNVFTEEVVGFYKSETLAEFQRIISSNIFSDFKHFLKYACLAMPEIQEGLQFKAVLKKHLALLLEKAIAKSLGGKDYIQAILGTRRSALERAMRDHKPLVAVIDEVCTDAINRMDQKRNPIGLLITYSNELMTKKSREEITEELKRIVDVMEFLNDKDKFIQQYWRVLRTRQIKESSSWDGNESTMISLLSKRLGQNVTAELTDQLKDFENSKRVNDKFQNHLKINGIKLGFDFRLKYFCNRGRDENFKLILPSELENAVQEFAKFHTEKRCVIVFNHQISCGEIIWNAGQSTHILEVSTLQMSILLLFNEQESFTADELAERLGTNIETIKPVLAFWIHIKFLISSGSSVEVNSDFTNRKRRLNFNKTADAAKTRKIEEKDDHKLRHERKFNMDAAIMRIMKKHKILEKSQLFSLVIEELKKFFTPSIGFIKERVDALTKKEDLELCGPTTYKYVS
nr:cullin homolog 1 [Drosophila takahashii]